MAYHLKASISLRRVSGDYMGKNPLPDFIRADITFKEMSEMEAVATFQADGYEGFKKQSDRGELLPFDSLWYTNPKRMFVAFSNVEDETKGRPVGVIGFAPLGKYAMGAGIHTRVPIGRGRDLAPIMVDKLLEEKGNIKLFINFTSVPAVKIYRDKGFQEIDLQNLPEDMPQQMQAELQQASQHPDLIEQLQKTLIYNVPHWWSVIGG